MASTASPSGQAVHTHVNSGSGTQIPHSGTGAQNIHQGSGNFYNNSPDKRSINISMSLFGSLNVNCRASTRGPADDGRNRNHRSLSWNTSCGRARWLDKLLRKNIASVRSTSSHDRSSSINTPSQLVSDSHTRKRNIAFIRDWFWNPGKRDAQGRTALHDAFRGGPLLVRHTLDNDEIHLLPGLHANIDLTNLINTPDKQGRTPAHHAVIRKDFYSLYILAEKGADLGLADKDGRTVLHLASELGQLSMVDYLLDKGVRPEKRDKRGLTALHLAAMKGHDVAVSSILRKAAQGGIHTLRREKENFDSWTPLHYAVLTGQLQVVEALVEKLEDKSDLDVRDCQGRTALHHACAIPTEPQSQEHEIYHQDACRVASAIVRILVDAGARLDLQASMGFTALMLAAKSANAEAVRCLVDNDADVHAVGGRGDDNPGRHNWTALDYAEHDAPLGEDRDKILRILSPGRPRNHFLRLL